MWKTTKERFQIDVLDNPRVVAILFYTSWSEQCLQQIALLGELENEMDVMTLCVDIEEEVELAEAYHISSVPMMKIFTDGISRRTVIGDKSKETLADELANFL